MEAPSSIGAPSGRLLENIPELNDNADPIKALDYLNSHPEFIQRNPDLTKSVITRIEMTDLANTNITETGWKTYHTFYHTHPELYVKPLPEEPNVTIKINDQERVIPKNHLLMHSEIFRSKFRFGGQGTSKNQIELIVDDCSDTDVISFLDYLETGKVSFTDDNIHSLLKLADMYFIKDLENKAVDFLKQVLTSYGLIVKLENKQLAIHGMKSNIFVSSIPHNLLGAINTLCQNSIVLLYLEDPELDDAKLENILKQLPNLEHLSIQSSKITNIPYTDRFNTLLCSGCTALTSINASSATKLNCSYCINLTSLNAPSAIKLDCTRCTNLTNLYAPLVTELECPSCSSLKSLNVPLATTVICNACSNLISLVAPLVTYLYCINCTNLTSLSAPSATGVECAGCPNLTSIDAPKAMVHRYYPTDF